MTTSSAGITSRCTTPSSAGGVGGSGGGGEGDEHIARCVALERAYVHEVYEQFQEAPRTRPWPRINQFLQDLEPGSLVCDVGCGNGKYLNVNQSIYKVGVDRCSRLTEIAREKENEVLLCDNLALPFRDESFDAVLSVAVVHHFATTERRVGALRELARLLRIGGRLVISVWAMEQRHRRFESQDVLVPWHRVPSPPQNGPRVNQHHNLSTPSLELTSTTNTSEEDVLPPYHAYTQTSDSDSNRSFRNVSNGGIRKRGRTRHKGRSIDPNRSSSPSSSSLSSPNETCYSFVRRAIQKLAGGKRGGSRHRPWFLDSWSYCSKETNQPRYDPDGCEDCDCEDIHDLPIELRRIEEDDVVQSKQSLVKNNSTDLYRGGHKSKSLGDIQTVKQESIIRSRSNVSNLKYLVTPTEEPSKQICPPKKTEQPVVVPTSRPKPKLVKQKKSLNEEDGEDLDKPLNQRDVVEALPDFRLMHSHYHNRRGNVFKQSSMNEELLSTERLREKERVRKNIQKQASLNEELIYRRYRTLDSLRDSIFSVSTSKRFQLIKNGFTTKLKNSTNNIEKVTSASLKNGFVRILQGWKTESMSSEKLVSEENGLDTSPNKQSLVSTIVEEKTSEPNERRHSREEGSDSSKDSSLQSDTSVDSEDSFASVIFVPKQESQDAMSPTPLSPAPTSPRVKSSSGPTSPRLKQSSCPTSPRLKQMPLSVYPLLKQPTSPKTAQQLKNVPSGGKVLIYSQSTPCKTNNNCTSPKSNENGNNCSDSTSPPKMLLKSPEQNLETVEEKSEILSDESEEPPSPAVTKNTTNTPHPETSKSFQDNIQKYRSLAEKYKIQKIPDFRPSVSRALGFDKNRTDRLKQIRELLNQRPGFGRNTRSAFPIVRRSSTQVSGKSELVAKSLPRLLSLELFNPETDDVDSDSSGVSSPDSVDSVISVEVPENTSRDAMLIPTVIYDNFDSEEKIEDTKKLVSPVHKEDKDLLKLDLLCSPEKEPVQLSPSSKSLLEAAANVASSLDNAVGAVIQSSPRLKRKQFDEIERSKILEVVSNDFDDNGVQNDDFCGVNDTDDLECLVQKSKNECTHFPFDDVVQVEEAENSSKEPFPTNERVNIDWENQCYKHLAEFAEQISENVLKEIDQYREESKRHKSLHGLENLPLDKFNDPYIHKLSEEIQDLTRLSAELIKERNLYLAKLNSETYSSDKVTNSVIVDVDEPVDKSNDCDSELREKSPVLEQSTSENNILSVAQDSVATVVDRNDSVQSAETETKSPPLRTPDRDTVLDRNNDLNNSNSVIEQGSNTNVVNTELKSRECSTVDIKKLNANNNNSSDSLSVVTGGAGPLLSGLSQESSDAGDVSERTGSSDWSQGDSRRDTNSAGVTTDGGSTASLGSCKDWNRPRRIADGRSSSDDVPEVRRSPLVRQHASVQEPPEPADEPHVSLSDTSQESLPSDPAGGSITYHRYYHVFREGELDQLIEKYVENLHIISSYYDHASWCVVAEKVQVWTI